MNSELQRLMNRISGLPDDDLFRMVHLDSAQYRPEAITYAEAEMRKRCISIDQPEISSVTVSTRDESTWEIVCVLFELIPKRFIAFAIGFLSCTTFFIASNYSSYADMYNKINPHNCGFFYRFGFPFKLYEMGGFA